MRDPPLRREIRWGVAQRQHIERVLALTNSRVYGEGGAAKILGIKPSTLQSRMLKLGLRRPPDGGRGPES